MVKNPPAKPGDLGLILGSGKSPGGGNATHSSILAWEIPWAEEPGGLQSIPGRLRGSSWRFEIKFTKVICVESRFCVSHNIGAKQRRVFTQKTSKIANSG